MYRLSPRHIEDDFTNALDYDANGNLIFQGIAKISTAQTAPGWKIKKFTYDVNNNLTDVQYADGNDNFDNIWNNRATHTYS